MSEFPAGWEMRDAEDEIVRLRARVRELEAALDIERRTVECPECGGEGEVHRVGYSLNPSSGVRVPDPQAEASDECPTCRGCGHVLKCKRCNGYGGIGPAGDRNCPECAGDGVDEEGTTEQVAKQLLAVIRAESLPPVSERR